jgi:hypothetical protein
LALSLYLLSVRLLTVKGLQIARNIEAPAEAATPEGVDHKEVTQVVDRSVAQGVKPAPRQGEASPPPTVDGRYARLLADDLGVKITTARTAFIGEPVARALKVREWAFSRAPNSPEKRAKLIIEWAKRQGAGAFRQDDDAEREIARRMALYWAEHPERLAETLREAMNGRSA